jgi:hypothetical protein
MIAVDEPWMNHQTMGATRGSRTLKLSMVFARFASGSFMSVLRHCKDKLGVMQAVDSELIFIWIARRADRVSVSGDVTVEIEDGMKWNVITSLR